MNTVLPTAPIQLFLNPVMETTDREGRGHQLRADQVIRAVVVEGEGGRLMLEMNHRRFLPQTQFPMQPGQQLDVRVLATNPHLSLQILPPSKSVGQLDKMLSALGFRVDWAGLASEVEGMAPQLPAGVRQQIQPPLQALQVLLAAGSSLKGTDLAQLSQLLGLSTEAEAVTQNQLPRNLKVGLMGLLALARGGKAPSQEPQVRALLQELTGFRHQGDSLASLGKGLEGMVDRMQGLQRSLPPALAEGLRHVVPQLQQWSPAVTQPSAASLQALEQALGVPLRKESPVDIFVPTDLRVGLLALAGRVASQGGTIAQSEAMVLDTLKQIVRQLENLPSTGPQLAKALPQLQALMARAEGLRDTLQPGQFALIEQPLASLRKALPPEWIRPMSENELAAVVTALGLGQQQQPFVNFQGPDNARVILEILLGLLTLGKETGGSREAESALQQLEVLQLARGRLADEGTQLLPLPFPFLEEGYLLVDQLPEEEEGSGEGGGYRLRLQLRLQHLGNLQVDALYQDGGLFVRFHGESPFVVDYLQRHREALEAGMSALPLRSLTFAQGAEDPGTELIQRLRKAENRMLDQRV